ncbi:MAG TPA: hypothetical protein VF587_18465 [Solirubrobacteraceae bacterium]|jgi:hypothetical protein
MIRIKRLAALAAVAASFAAVAAPSASAQEVDLYVAPPPCDNVPACVNYAIDTVDGVRQLVDDTYNNVVQPQIDYWNCETHYIITGDRCD